MGEFESLAAIGIKVDAKGKLELDEAKLTSAFKKNPTALKQLFADEDRGFVAKMNAVVEQLAGEDNSLLTARTDSLTRTIDSNNERLEDLSAQLDRQRERLLMQFYSIESMVAKLQSNLTALSALQIIPPLGSSNN